MGEGAGESLWLKSKMIDTNCFYLAEYGIVNRITITMKACVVPILAPRAFGCALRDPEKGKLPGHFGDMQMPEDNRLR